MLFNYRALLYFQCEFLEIFNVWSCFPMEWYSWMRETRVIDYFRLFIVASGCPSEQGSYITVRYTIPDLSDAPRRLLVVTGDSARIQDETTESWFFNVLNVLHRQTGPQFKVSSERRLIIVRLTSPESNPQPRVF